MFDPARLSLLDRGFVFAIAHVRGGGEMGRTWYEQGRLLHKRNTFTDFIACAEHLVAERRTRPELLAIRGRSAGGLLIGAVLNERPDLFACAGALPVPCVPSSSAAVGAAGCLPLVACRVSRGTRRITLARTAIDTATRRKYRIVRIAWPPR